MSNDRQHKKTDTSINYDDRDRHHDIPNRCSSPSSLLVELLGLLVLGLLVLVMIILLYNDYFVFLSIIVIYTYTKQLLHVFFHIIAAPARLISRTSSRRRSAASYHDYHAFSHPVQQLSYKHDELTMHVRPRRLHNKCRTLVAASKIQTHLPATTSKT